MTEDVWLEEACCCTTRLPTSCVAVLGPDSLACASKLLAMSSNASSPTTKSPPTFRSGEHSQKGLMNDRTCLCNSGKVSGAVSCRSCTLLLQLPVLYLNGWILCILFVCVCCGAFNTLAFSICSCSYVFAVALAINAHSSICSCVYVHISTFPFSHVFSIS